MKAVPTVVSEQLAEGWTFTLPQGGAAAPTAPMTAGFEDGTDGWGPRGDGVQVTRSTATAHTGLDPRGRAARPVAAAGHHRARRQRLDREPGRRRQQRHPRPVHPRRRGRRGRRRGGRPLLPRPVHDGAPPGALPGLGDLLGHQQRPQLAADVADRSPVGAAPAVRRRPAGGAGVLGHRRPDEAAGPSGGRASAADRGRVDAAGGLARPPRGEAGVRPAVDHRHPRRRRAGELLAGASAPLPGGHHDRHVHGGGRGRQHADQHLRRVVTRKQADRR